nr:hypothetical protein Iba_chr14dCG4350 [Ipomoea batatas]
MQKAFKSCLRKFVFFLPPWMKLSLRTSIFQVWLNLRVVGVGLWMQAEEAMETQWQSLTFMAKNGSGGPIRPSVF